MRIKTENRTFFMADVCNDTYLFLSIVNCKCMYALNVNIFDVNLMIFDPIWNFVPINANYKQQLKKIQQF